MGVLVNSIKGERLMLLNRHSFGRSSCNFTVFEYGDVSKTHAIIFWGDGGWNLRDKSRNGTLINGVCISKDTIPLKLDDEIRFAQDSWTSWKLIDVEKPKSFLHCLSRKNKFIQLSDCLFYPDDKQNKVCFFMNSEGKWQVDLGEEIFLLSNGEHYEIAGDKWLYVENELLENTFDNDIIKDLAKFEFSLDGQRGKVQLNIRFGEQYLNLKHRSFNPMLFVLAKRTQNDMTKGCAESTQGWMTRSEIIQSLEDFNAKEGSQEDTYIDEYYINIQVFRFRKFIINAPPNGYLFADVLQKKRGYLRFYHKSIEIRQADIKEPVS